MELFVNGSKLDIQLENEKTVGDVLKSFEEQSSKEGIATVNIIVDGKNITADLFDETAKKHKEGIFGKMLNMITPTSSVFTDNDVENIFNNENENTITKEKEEVCCSEACTIF